MLNPWLIVILIIIGILALYWILAGQRKHSQLLSVQQEEPQEAMPDKKTAVEKKQK